MRQATEGQRVFLPPARALAIGGSGWGTTRGIERDHANVDFDTGEKFRVPLAWLQGEDFAGQAPATPCLSQEQTTAIEVIGDEARRAGLPWEWGGVFLDDRITLGGGLEMARAFYRGYDGERVYGPDPD